MKLNIIEEAIFELEESEATVSNIQQLANLYTVRENFNKNEENIINEAVDRVTEELKDILPQYRHYKEIKIEYQLQHLNHSAVLVSLKSVCKELKEFIQVLYTNTDSQEERTEILNILTELNKSLKASH